jgi:hypothetical protein
MAKKTNPGAPHSSVGDDSRVSRRSVLQFLGTAFAVSTLPEALSACGVEALPGGESNETNDIDLNITSRVDVVRPQDLLVLSIGFNNLRKNADGRLARERPADAAYIVLDFPPQAILEEAIGYVDGAAPATNRLNHVAAAKLGGPSRLAFKLPGDFSSEEYTLEKVLALCSGSTLVLPGDTDEATAAVRASTAPITPADTFGLHPFAAARVDRIASSFDPGASHRMAQRAASLGLMGGAPAPALMAATRPIPYTNEVASFIEMPYRLLLAPSRGTAWSHTASAPSIAYPLAKPERVELWHTKLCGRDMDGRPDFRSTAASYAQILRTRDEDLPDPGISPVTGQPIETVTNESLSRKQRLGLTDRLRFREKPKTARIREMMLTSLGGYLDARADFPGDPDLRGWIHRMTGGREHFVQVTELGFLLPFGHKATKLTITERNTDARRGQVGALLKYIIVLVDNPLVWFGTPRPNTIPTAGEAPVYTPRNDLPFCAVELKRHVFVLPTATSNKAAFPLQIVNGVDIQVPAVGYDQGGNAIPFELPLYYFTGAGSAAGGQVAEATTHYKGHPINTNGSRIKYAPSNLDDTTFETKSLELEIVPDADTSFPARARVLNAELCVESVRQVTGEATTRYCCHPLFSKYGLEAGNEGQLLFLLATFNNNSNVRTITFKSSESGSTGFVRPNLNFNAVSRTTGTSLDLARTTEVAARTPLLRIFAPTDGPAFLPFDPKEFFKQNPAAAALDKMMLFGAIPLSSVLKAVNLKDAADNLIKDPMKFAPKFVSEAFGEIEKFIGIFTQLQDKLSTLESHARDEIKALEKDASTTLANGKKKLEGAVLTKANEISGAFDNVSKAATDLFHAVEDVPTDIKNLTNGGLEALTGWSNDPNQRHPESSHIRNIQRKLTLLKTRLTELETKVTNSHEVADALARPMGVADGIFEDFDRAVKQAEAWFDEGTQKLKEIFDLFSAVQRGIEAVRDLTLKLEWRPTLDQYTLRFPFTDPNGVPLVSFHPDCAQGLLLSMETRAKAKDGKPAGVDLVVRMDRFSLHFAGTDVDNAVLTLRFKHLILKKLAGKKPDVDLVFRDMKFGGPLKFVQTLIDILPRDGFSDPPYLLVEASGIRAGFTLAIPTLAVGMFSLENVKIGAELFIPLLGESALKFSFFFCTRDAPFLCTVSALGGGGYFKFEMDTSGAVAVEGSLMVAASLAVNLGVAAASVTISAGIFFSFSKDKAQIGGFLRLHGQLSLLGFITISVDLRLDLIYEPANEKIIGRAMLRVEIDITFFSQTIEIPFERSFCGSNGDPTMSEVMGLPEGKKPEDWTWDEEWAWKDYVHAFS